MRKKGRRRLTSRRLSSEHASLCACLLCSPLLLRYADALQRLRTLHAKRAKLRQQVARYEVSPLPLAPPLVPPQTECLHSTSPPS